MRRIFLAIILAASLVPAAAAGPPGFMRFERSEADTEALTRIGAYLNAIHTMKGSFVQIGPDGQLDEGVFFIDKPGRMRFEYHAPNPVLIVSDGSTVAVANRKLGTVDHYPVWSTPLDLLLSNDVDLNDSRSIAGVSHEPGELVLRVRAASDRANGNLTLVFADPDIELRQWTIVDAQGLSTIVSLRDVQRDVPLDPSLFVLPTKDSVTKDEE